MQIEKTSSYVEWYYDSSTKKLKTTQSSHHPKNYYTLFRKGEEGDGDLNLQRIHLPNTKTIFEFSTMNNINEESYCKLAEEIIKECPHKDIELKLPII